MLQVDDLLLMAALMRSPSLSAAARTLNVTAPALSMRLKRLEAALGMRLAVRSARRAPSLEANQLRDNNAAHSAEA